MRISITSHREPEPLDLSAFERLAVFVLEREDTPEEIELSLAVVEVEEMIELNRRYRGAEGPTDVLAFECDDLCAVALPGEPVTLGDVVVCPQVAEEHARHYGRRIEEELNLILVHGVLHLLGYSHESDEDEAVMQARERTLLEAWAAVL